MKNLQEKSEIVKQLQAEILAMQGFRAPVENQILKTGLGTIERSFPNRIFPTGAIHEFISLTQEDVAASNGFIAGLVSTLIQGKGACLWIGAKRTVFPPGLASFGIDPSSITFINTCRQKDVLWTIEEALKCDALTCVIGEIGELSFTESRRLQLAVEESRVTGFIHRYQPRSENNVACVARWKIQPASSVEIKGLPGIGFPQWKVQLTKIRNGMPGNWQLGWVKNKFIEIPYEFITAARTNISQAV